MDMADEAGVDERDPALGGNGGQQPGGLGDIGCGLYVEAE